MTYGPIPGDEGLEMPMLMIEQLNAGDHILADSVTTCAAEVWQASGEHHQYAIIVEAEGRLNKLDLRNTQRFALSVEAATILRDNLSHSLGVLKRQAQQ